jgi:single-strand DNA-binding protein
MRLVGVGRLGRDAEVRYTPSGTAVADLSLAFNYGQKEDGKQPTQWVKAGLWGKRAEKLAEYLTKGTLLDVTLNNVHVRTYETKSGEQGAALEATVETLDFVPVPRRQEATYEEKHRVDDEPAQFDDDIPF